jgi:adenylate cyclase
MRTCEPGRIQVALPASDRLRAVFVLEDRGTIEVKGKGAMTTSYLVSRRPMPTA